MFTLDHKLKAPKKTDKRREILFRKFDDVLDNQENELVNAWSKEITHKLGDFFDRSVLVAFDDIIEGEE